MEYLSFSPDIQSGSSSVCCYTILLFCLLTVTLAELIVTPTDVNVTTGDNVRLRCSTNSMKPINWQFGKQWDRMRDVYISGEGLFGSYKTNGRYRVEENSTSGHYDLLIRNATFDDAGYYKCSEPTGKDDPPHARLLVSGMESLTKFCRTNSMIVVTGKNAVLEFSKCRVESFYISHVPVGEVHSKDVYNKDSLLNGYASNGRFRVQKSNGACQLSIDDTRSSDAGTFTCIDSHGFGEKHAIQLAIVESLPKCSKSNSSESHLLKTRLAVEATCVVNFTGNCVPLLKWHFLNESESQGVTSSTPVQSQNSDNSIQSTLVYSSENEIQLRCDIWQPITTGNDPLQCVTPLENDHHGIQTTEAQQSSDHSTTAIVVGLIVGLILVVVVVVVIIVIMVCYRRRKSTSNKTASASESVALKSEPLADWQNRGNSQSTHISCATQTKEPPLSGV